MPRPQAYPPTARLRLRRDFQVVQARARKFPGRECLVRRLARDAGGARLGIASPRAYGNAVRRNRFRRLVREAFRRLGPRLGSFDLLVSPRRGLVEPTLAGIEADLLAAAARPSNDPPGGTGAGRAAGPPNA